MLLRNQRYPAQILTAKMAGNSGGVGTKDFGRICFIRFFINVNSLLKKIKITTGYLKASRKAACWFTKSGLFLGGKCRTKNKSLLFLDIWQDTCNKIRGCDRKWNNSYLPKQHFSRDLTSPPSSLKIAEDPIQSDGTIFLLHRRRRTVSEERSFLWNFQPMREEYSQPSVGSRLCRRN